MSDLPNISDDVKSNSTSLNKSIEDVKVAPAIDERVKDVLTQCRKFETTEAKQVAALNRIYAEELLALIGEDLEPVENLHVRGYGHKCVACGFSKNELRKKLAHWLGGYSNES